jgi:hypothetical protein
LVFVFGDGIVGGLVVWWFGGLVVWWFLVLAVCLPARRLFVCSPAALAFPCFLIGLLASPLCGAGTYFSLPAAKKSRQKKAAHTASP